MAGNPFDQAARYLAKMEPVGFLAWLLGLAPGLFVFRRWLDTRLLRFPGEPDRTCDTVAFVEDVARGQLPWAEVEFQLEPDAVMFGRLLGYLAQLWLEQKPSGERGDRFQVGAVVVNLTGGGSASRTMDWPEAGLFTGLRVVERNLAGEDAQATLAGVTGARVTPAVLPLIPLMQGGGEAAIIQGWLAQASAEADARRRADYAGLAVVFAEAAGRAQPWKQALRGWNMIESKQVLEWQTQERAATLLEMLEAKFGTLPAEMAEAVRATTDRDQLKGWVVLAARANTLEEFRRDAGV